jgi:predicted Zn-dependent peptidase
MDLALDVLKRIHANGVTAEQLKSAKAYVMGTYPTQALETSDQIANVLGDMELFGQNRGEVDDMFSRINGVTLEQANAMANKHFKPENLTFVVLGNASKIRDVVKKYAPTIQEVSIKEAGWGK